jgi:hypothetical protein
VVEGRKHTDITDDPTLDEDENKDADGAGADADAEHAQAEQDRGAMPLAGPSTREPAAHNDEDIMITDIPIGQLAP